MYLFSDQIGIKDHLTGRYIINLPSWSRTVYYKGTRIQYVHNSNQDSIALDGPTKVPFRIVVSIPSENDYRLKNIKHFVLINLSGWLVLLIQFVYIRGDPKGVEFQYFRPLLSNESTPNVPSKWVTGKWSPCSRTCGKGNSVRCHYLLLGYERLSPKES